MKIFVTGASGFIGLAICKALSAEHEVIGMARTEEKAEWVKATGAGAVVSSVGMLGDFKGAEVVIHCAAFVSPWGKWEQFQRATVEGTERMLGLARNDGVKRFIHMGTEAVLMDGKPKYDVNESHPYPAKCPYYYSESKKLAEQKVLAANEPGVFETISLRPRFVWGPGDKTLLPNLLEMIDKKSFKWVSGGKIPVSTCHIDNLVQAVKLSLSNGRGGESYFITDERQTTVREIVTLMLTQAGRSNVRAGNVPGWFVRMAAWWFEFLWKLFGIRSKPPITKLAAAVMSLPFTIKSDKAEKELGYKPKKVLP